ncbi:MAG: hypothetical protein LBI08_03230, partial [Methanomassiliicoccaceae archaeon]|nr:hypothetical protein [Methanomassiliicoccaceae archaeon]
MICPRCGHNDPNANLFCSSCGESLVREERPSGRLSNMLRGERSKGAPRKMGNVILAVILTAILIVGAMVYLNAGKENVPVVTLSSNGKSVG